MHTHETPLESRSLGTLAYEYDEQVLRFEDAGRALARLEKSHRDLSKYAEERADAYVLAKSIRLVLVKKLADLDTRLGLTGADR